VADDRIIGNLGQRFNSLTTNAQLVSSGLQTYRGAFAEPVVTICTRIIGQNVEQLKTQFVVNYATHISNRLAQLKLPLRLGATEAYSSAELVATRKNFVNGLEADLNDPVWKSFPPGAAILGPLRNNSYTSVGNGLLNPDGTIAEMELVFAPPPSGSAEARPYSLLLRYLKVSVDGKEKFNQDLSRIKDATAIVTNVPASASVRFEFFSDVERNRQTAAVGEESWLLPRLIQKDQAQRLPTRDTEWRLKLPVTVNGAASTLEAFAIRTKNPLPKKEDWPK
jgi:hypothetical protein